MSAHKVTIDLNQNVATGIGPVIDMKKAGLKTDVIAESTAAAGVTVDGVKLKDGGVTMADGSTIKPAANTAGMNVGGAVTDKLGFYGATPIVQRVGAAQTAVATTGATNTTPYGFASAAQADAIVTLANELRAALVAVGIIKGAA